MNCALCRFWFRSSRSVAMAGQLGHKAGECRRHPPQLVPIPQGAISAFPTTEPTTVCGEWQALEPKQ